MSEPFVYTKTTLQIADDEPSRNWKGTAALGAQLPDRAITLLHAGVHEQTYLRKLLGSGYVILYFGNKDLDCLQVLEAVDAELPEVRLTIFPVLAEEIENRTTLQDADGSLGRLLQAPPGTALIIRPDRHLAARRHHASPDGITMILRQLLDPARR